MNDNYRRYHLIRQGLEQLFPTKLAPSQLRLLRTLALLINGLIASGHCQLPRLAAKTPLPIKLESRVAKFKRFLSNEKVTQQTFWLPFARQLLGALTDQQSELIVALDGSTMGQGCIGLVATVGYAGRSLPIAWLVVEGKKGHLSQERHLELVEQLAGLFEPATKVVLLGDGEFDGTGLLARVQELGWRYVVRTAKNSVLYEQDSELSFEELGVGPGGTVGVPQAQFTRARYGPVLAVAVWEIRCDEPLYLVCNLGCAYLARDYYRRRGRIECCFSDLKSRGFRLDKSHLDDPARLSRLVLAAVLAYWWLTYLGVVGREQEWDKLVHRTNRTDLSFFQLGWRILDEFLMGGRRVPFRLDLFVTALF